MAGPQNVPKESAVQVASEKLVAAMEQEMQQYLESVMQAVNDAPDGAWIAGSEESVRDLSADFRRRVFRPRCADAGGRGGSRFFPLRTTRQRASVWRIKVAKTSPCSRSTAVSRSGGVGGTHRKQAA